MCQTTMFSMNGSDKLECLPTGFISSQLEVEIMYNNLPKISGKLRIFILCFYHISETNRKTRLWCWLGLKQLKIVFRIYLDSLL
jgi:hypothetical protein